MEKVDKTVLRFNIIQLKKILKCRTEEQNAGNDLFMDVCETNESNNHEKNNAEQDKRNNEESANLSICPANVGNEVQIDASVPMQVDTEETKMDISPVNVEAGNEKFA